MIRPILILSLICFFVTGILAFVNNLTYPVIESAAAERAANARKEIIPHADRFELLKINGLPLNVTQVYRAEYDKGFIFMVTTFGYGGEIKLFCGIDTDGKLIKTAVLAQSETKGFGTPVFEEPHAGQFWGRDKNGIEEIQAISGATISSNAFKKGIRDSFEAFEIIKGIKR